VQSRLASRLGRRVALARGESCRAATSETARRHKRPQRLSGFAPPGNSRASRSWVARLRALGGPGWPGGAPPLPARDGVLAPPRRPSLRAPAHPRPALSGRGRRARFPRRAAPSRRISAGRPGATSPTCSSPATSRCEDGAGPDTPSSPDARRVVRGLGPLQLGHRRCRASFCHRGEDGGPLGLQ